MQKLKDLTQKELKEFLSYDPLTGDFTRTKEAGGQVEGTIAGCRSDGYIRITIKNKTYMAHRLAWLYMEGYWPEHQIDHIDRNRANNRWENLRHVSRSCNIKNTGLKKNNTSGVTGVSYWKDCGKYGVYINHNQKPVFKGKFNNFNEAVLVRWRAEVEYGYPNCNTTSTAYQYLKEHNLI